MLFFFADDAKQSKPSRPGMGPLVSSGAIMVPEIALRVLDLQINSLCAEFGFPDGQEFKWSPGRELWMHANLVDEARQRFYLAVLRKAAEQSVSATVVIADASEQHATDASGTEEDVTRLLLERIQLQIPFGEQGTVIADRPGGDRANEDQFLSGCFDAIKNGTRLVRNFELIALLLTTNSRMSRLIQLADIITSASLAFVSGEPRFAPSVFCGVLPLLRRDQGRVGGVGLKLQPEKKYANLYHWLGEDRDYIHANMTYPMPLPRYPYAQSCAKP
jgi:hypothetical protein